jgi:pimeloyl-ACP methyl ester carboxylesterase
MSAGALSGYRFRSIDTNGVRLRAVVEGDGPLVILLHGFPQCWALWHHQLAPLVAAGYQVAIPDQRGYGGSDAPAALDAYNIRDLCADVAGIADALGHRKFHLAGHDWGSLVAWHTALLHPQRIRSVCGMSVPYARARHPEQMTRQEYHGERFWYWVYFQQPDKPEAELDRDIRRSLRLIYQSVSGEARDRGLMAPKPHTAGLLDGIPDDLPLPGWLSADYLDYVASQYSNNGFRGPVNWYRNWEHNASITPELAESRIEAPALFLTGDRDIVLSFPGDLFNSMDRWFTDLRGKHLLPDAGHWIPLESPDRVTRHLLDFLSSVS